ncbi:MAG TPA: aspartate-semialdehyde dehydrogenase, partial [Bacillota bacterium]|nr:aspartate-semialdehyde dehydrogenase [Bacillota bacterium]
MRGYNIAIIGATGMVGQKVLEVLAERQVVIKNYHLFASARSTGKKVHLLGKDYLIEELNEQCFDGKEIDIAIFSAGGAISKKFAPIAVEKGITVIDNSSAWRMEGDVPLVVPEVNAQAILSHKGIIANPNCSTIQAVVALYPLHDKFKIKRLVYSTYQAVSGAGAGGYNDLERGIKGDKQELFVHPIFGNCIPHIDEFTDRGYTKEEIKMIDETKKILDDQSLRITATTVRVPVFHSHSESINIEFENDFELGDIRETLAGAKGIKVIDDPSTNAYPMPIYA